MLRSRHCRPTPLFCAMFLCREKLMHLHRLRGEPYDTLIAKILAACSAVQTTEREEKRNLPPTPPIKKKGEKACVCTTNPARARTRGTFEKPTVEEIAAHIREKGYTFDAEEFWNFYESKGWRVGSHVMKSWTSACVTWQKRRDDDAKRQARIDAKMDEREAARQAHIDAKMDEREAKRARQMQKRADNYIAPTEEDLEEVRRDYNF